VPALKTMALLMSLARHEKNREIPRRGHGGPTPRGRFLLPNDLTAASRISPTTVKAMQTTSTLTRADALIHALLRPDAPAPNLQTLAILVGASGAMQGAAMGSYALFNGGPAIFMIWAAIKVPLFLGLAAGLCFPALRTLYFLLGLGDEFPFAVRALASGQAAFAAILAALSPLVLVFYASGVSYRAALWLNLALFAVAGLAAQSVMRGRLLPLVKREARHLKLWGAAFGIWAFVAIQLAWNLRPFIGAPWAPAQFLRADAFSNVYVGLWKLLVG